MLDIQKRQKVFMTNWKTELETTAKLIYDLDDLVTARTEALKNKDKETLTILTLLYSDAQALAKKQNKRLTDTELLEAAENLYKKTLSAKQVAESAQLSKAQEETRDSWVRQLQILKPYTPIALTTLNYKQFIEDCIEESKTSKPEMTTKELEINTIKLFKLFLTQNKASADMKEFCSILKERLANV